MHQYLQALFVFIYHIYKYMAVIMENTPLQALFTSDIGLLSLFTIFFVLGMAVYIFFYVRRKVSEDTVAHLKALDKNTSK